MVVIGCYTLDLYCDACEEQGTPSWKIFSAQYTADRREETIRAARNDGWIVNENRNRAVCPVCSRKKRVENRKER
jgi:hypothetical protein